VIATAALLSSLFASSYCTGVSPRILAGIVRQESGGDPLAIHDDTESRSYWPRDVATASALIVRLDAARHAHSVGLMQIENSNWAAYRVTGTQLLDPALNTAVGCDIYRRDVAALRAYNTGSSAPSDRGNRYAEAVFLSIPLPLSAPTLTPPSATPTVIPRKRRVVRLKITRKRSKMLAEKLPSFGFSAADPAVR